MKTMLIIERPSALVAACAPVSAAPVRPSFPIDAVRDAVVDGPVGGWGPVTADAPQLPQVHRVRVQAELAQSAVLAGESYGTNGTNGSTVKGAEMRAKRHFAARSGVPPRGRPV